MSKAVKYIIGIVAVLLIVWLSLDIKNLQVHQAKMQTIDFNAQDYASRFWNEDLPQSISNAPDFSILLNQFSENQKNAFKKNGRKLGISKTYYFLLKGTGVVQSVEEEYISVLVNGKDTIHIATAFIFGNAVRDGSGRVNINDFINMTDFNNVSIAINKQVREKIASPLKKSAEQGKQIDFVGVVELKEDQTLPEALRIIPVKCDMSDGKSD